MDKNSQKKITIELNADEFKKLQKLLELDEKNEQDQQKKESEKKNLNFIQLYRDNMPELRWLMANHNFASSLLFFIIEHMDNKNALACSYSTFEDYFGKSKMTIYRGIKVLEENGFLSVLKMGTSNVYLVNEDLAWTDSNDKKKFTKYDGKILVSKKENKDYIYRKQFDRFKALRKRENLK
ncbi:replication/maintenance protein RepL [Bacillus paranthracis]|uniref:replication/maintenance protein RepL n=1 Tax=Bacillus paranthracis TaxID=2026186 RepID=UPI00065B54E7|nr:replication/maintenance protein RepL [Bacillus paranthracis]KMP82061.1 replication protein [Bacillus cereus]MDG0913378.1 replication/maintenance protein RepL [Bacillus paranthracis]MDR4352622.1 replication protein [Bacillus paranthracis]TKC15249.1 replication protein [Bacillus paranthracis]HDR7461326.1 replication/maintenance protein RepL [Bacillus paranthracis]